MPEDKEPLVRVPSDLVEEVESELEQANQTVSRDQQRLEALRSLQEIVRTLAQKLQRPITVADLVRSAIGTCERERRLEMLRTMRSPVDSSRTIRDNTGRREAGGVY